MKKLLIISAAIAGVLLIAVFMIAMSVVGIYNGFVNERQSVNTMQGQVETQLQRRNDLIPNLIEAPKGIFNQEQLVFKAIADARSHYAGTSPGSADRMKAASGLDSAIGRLLVVIENYPNLKSNENVQDLMSEMAGTENRINIARQRYNESVQVYDSDIERFPGRVFASLFGFQSRPYYEADASSKVAPKANLMVNSIGGSK